VIEIDVSEEESERVKEEETSEVRSISPDDLERRQMFDRAIGKSRLVFPSLESSAEYVSEMSSRLKSRDFKLSESLETSPSSSSFVSDGHDEQGKIFSRIKQLYTLEGPLHVNHANFIVENFGDARPGSVKVIEGVLMPRGFRTSRSWIVFGVDRKNSGLLRVESVTCSVTQDFRFQINSRPPKTSPQEAWIELLNETVQKFTAFMRGYSVMAQRITGQSFRKGFPWESDKAILNMEEADFVKNSFIQTGPDFAIFHGFVKSAKHVFCKMSGRHAPQLEAYDDVVFDLNVSSSLRVGDSIIGYKEGESGWRSFENVPSFDSIRILASRKCRSREGFKTLKGLDYYLEELSKVRNQVASKRSSAFLFGCCLFGLLDSKSMVQESLECFPDAFLNESYTFREMREAKETCNLDTFESAVCDISRKENIRNILRLNQKLEKLLQSAEITSMEIESMRNASEGKSLSKLRLISQKKSGWGIPADELARRQRPSSQGLKDLSDFFRIDSLLFSSCERDWNTFTLEHLYLKTESTCKRFLFSDENENAEISPENVQVQIVLETLLARLKLDELGKTEAKAVQAFISRHIHLEAFNLEDDKMAETLRDLQLTPLDIQMFGIRRGVEEALPCYPIFQEVADGSKNPPVRVALVIESDTAIVQVVEKLVKNVETKVKKDHREDVQRKALCRRIEEKLLEKRLEAPPSFLPHEIAALCSALLKNPSFCLEADEEISPSTALKRVLAPHLLAGDHLRRAWGELETVVFLHGLDGPFYPLNGFYVSFHSRVVSEKLRLPEFSDFPLLERNMDDSESLVFVGLDGLDIVSNRFAGCFILHVTPDQRLFLLQSLARRVSGGDSGDNEEENNEEENKRENSRELFSSNDDDFCLFGEGTDDKIRWSRFNSETGTWEWTGDAVDVKMLKFRSQELFEPTEELEKQELEQNVEEMEECETRDHNITGDNEYYGIRDEVVSFSSHEPSDVAQNKEKWSENDPGSLFEPVAQDATQEEIKDRIHEINRARAKLNALRIDLLRRLRPDIAQKIVTDSNWAS